MCLRFAKSAVEVILLDKDLLERRLFELKLEGDGLTLKEIVAETSIKFSASHRDGVSRDGSQSVMAASSAGILRGSAEG